MPVQNSLILGCAKPFWGKTQMQFGKLFMTTVAPHPKGTEGLKSYWKEEIRGRPHLK